MTSSSKQLIRRHQPTSCELAWTASRVGGEIDGKPRPLFLARAAFRSCVKTAVRDSRVCVVGSRGSSVRISPSGATRRAAVICWLLRIAVHPPPRSTPGSANITSLGSFGRATVAAAAAAAAATVASLD
uniref:Uncharacterized protein n=1 Tax=Plectus sambesii TaxID=2011161 RepID=A0A914US12_9BILA